MHPIYLDYAAATPLDKRVLEAMLPYFQTDFYNPSATYMSASRVRQDLEAARASIAESLGARPSEVIFTAGGTEANNLAIHGVLGCFSGKKIIVSAIEHESVLAPARLYPCIEAPVRADGLLDMAALRQLVDDDTVLISVMYANNEVGAIQPLREIAALIKETVSARLRQGNDLPLYFHTDAAQAGNCLDVHVSRLGVDLMTFNGGKIYGPKQSGLLWIRSGVELTPLIYGGGQERGLRSGTENVAACIGLSEALRQAQALRHEESRRLQQLQQLFYVLLQEQVPLAIINGSQKKRLPNNVHCTIPGHDNERLLMALDDAGIMAAAGSACSASSEEPSHVLRAMGVSPEDAQSSLRFTFGRSTTADHIHHAVTTLAGLLRAAV